MNLPNPMRLSLTPQTPPILAESNKVTHGDSFTVDYFIQKFEAIPDEKWCQGWVEKPTGERCALGHCGVKSERSFWTHSEEALALGKILRPFVLPNHSDEECGRDDYYTAVYLVNDRQRFGCTPKARILGALRDIKAKQEAA
jgi:hypothetical protein